MLMIVLWAELFAVDTDFLLQLFLFPNIFATEMLSLASLDLPLYAGLFFHLLHFSSIVALANEESVVFENAVLGDRDRLVVLCL